MDAGVIGRNVRRIRATRKLSQVKLARGADISRVALSKIENGIHVPRAETLERLAAALEVDVEQFVTEVPDVAGVRFRALKRHHERDQIIADVAQRLKRYLEIEELLGKRREFKLGKLLPKKNSSPVELARIVRKQTVLKNEPIRDICGFLEDNGVKVLRIRRATDAFYGLSVAPDTFGPAIIINTWERISVERWIFSAAHELGHLLMHLNAYDRIRTVEDPREEKEANSFAGHFLMPQKLFTSEWEKTSGLPFVDRVFKVKRIFKVSYRTVLYRLVENGQADKQVWKVFQNRYRARHGRTLRRADEPMALGQGAFFGGIPVSRRAYEPEQLSDIDFREDRLSRLVRMAFQRGDVSLGYAAETLDLGRSEMRSLAREWADLDDESHE